MRKDLDYMKKYQGIYKREFREAEKRDNDRYVFEAADKTKTMWRLIHREIDKALVHNHKLELENRK